jgi:hypothetical protein
LHLLAAPVLEMNRAAVRNETEERLMVELFEFSEDHRVFATLNLKSEI